MSPQLLRDSATPVSGTCPNSIAIPKPPDPRQSHTFPGNRAASRGTRICILVVGMDGGRAGRLMVVGSSTTGGKLARQNG